MPHSRRDALAAMLAVGAGIAVDGKAQATAATCADGDATSRAPQWAHGFEGQRKPDLGDGRFLNPIIPGDASDPDVVKDGNDYYMTFSSFDDAPGLPLYHSRDLVNWIPIGSALSQPVGSVLAPSLKKHDGRFFIYFPGAVRAAQGPGTAPGQGIGIYVVYADNIEGPWSEPVLIRAGIGIDPGHVVGEDGKRYLFLNAGQRLRLTDDGLAGVGPVEKVYDGWKYPDDWIDEGFGLESPKLFRRGEYFYLICAEGGTYGPPTSHMITVARSRSINGPWQNAPHNPLLRTQSAAEPWWSRGHGVLIDGPRGDWWVIYHAYENGYRSLGRQTLMEPVEWTVDDWPRVLPRDLSRPVRSPMGGQNIGSGQPLSDDFSRNRIGTLWRFAQPGPAEMSRVAYGQGSLTLQGKGSHIEDCSPLSCIPVDRAYEVSVEAELQDEIEAGLMLFIGPSLFVGIGHDGMRVKAYLKGGPTRGQAAPTPSRQVWFKLTNDHQIVSMFTSLDGQAWTRYPQHLEVSCYNQNVVQRGESLRIGLYAIGNGKVRLRNFVYRALGS